MAARLTLAAVAILLFIAAPFRWAQHDHWTAISNVVFGWFCVWLVARSKGARG